jgi:O-antigen/teichoic acid export membrane protein
VLAILALSQAVASLVGAAMVGVHPRAFWSRWWLGRYAPLWHQARWSLLGALTTMTQIRAQVVIVGTLADPAAYGAVFAGGILSGPVRLAAVAWSMVARPRLAEAAGRGERAVVRRLTVLPGLLFTAAFVVLAAAMAAAWPLIRAFLFVQYGDEMVPIVATWLASSYVQCLSDCVSAALQGLHEFRRLAIATVWGALVSLTAAFAAVLALGYAWVMLGPFLGQLVALGWMAQALRRSLAELPASA